MRIFRLQIKFKADDEIDIGIFNKIVDSTINEAMKMSKCTVIETRVEELDRFTEDKNV